MVGSKNSTAVKTLGLLNAEGLNLFDVKRVLFSSVHNPLVFNSIASSLKKEDYEEKIYNALFDEKVSEQKFEGILLTFSKYGNQDVLKKQFEDFRKKLSNLIERKGRKHFSTEVSLSKGGVTVVKKIGINLDFIRREFLVTEREANKLQKNGFVEKYANLKVNAMVKHMIERAEKACGKSFDVRFELSEFYLDEQSNYYNVDFIAVIPLSETQLQSPTSYLNEYTKYLDNVLGVIEKECHRTING
jgi:hypothetical protein